MKRDDGTHFSSPLKLSKNDFELFRDENASAAPVIRIHRFGNASRNTEKWRIYRNNEIVFVVEGAKIGKKDREFLRTVEGLVWLIAVAKLGFSSMKDFRELLKTRHND